MNAIGDHVVVFSNQSSEADLQANSRDAPPIETVARLATTK
jgi:hypothetical protein